MADGVASSNSVVASTSTEQGEKWGVPRDLTKRFITVTVFVQSTFTFKSAHSVHGAKPYLQNHLRDLETKLEPEVSQLP